MDAPGHERVLLIGAAGWHYEDWAGPVYPKSAPARRWLELYVERFPIAEIDSTFYAIPPPATVEGWIERTRKRPDFKFTAKVPKDATHSALLKGDVSAIDAVAREFVDIVVEPLTRAGRYEASLVQLPPAFERSAESIRHLDHLLAALAPECRVAVEFRNATWRDESGRVHADAAAALRGRGIVSADVDGLGSKISSEAPGEWGYFRFHGRRGVVPEEERHSRHAAYDYLYSRPELLELAAPVRRAAERQRRTLVIFNNHYGGQAVRNAESLAEILHVTVSASTAPKRVRLDDF